MTKNERVFEKIEIYRIYYCFAPNTIYYGRRTNEYAARTNWEHANKETRWNGSNRLKIRNIAQFTIFFGYKLWIGAVLTPTRKLWPCIKASMHAERPTATPATWNQSETSRNGSQ